MAALPLHPTVYLDYDGVCHPAGVPVSLTGKLPRQSDLFVYAPILSELLASYPAIEIVLTTRWSWVVGCKRAAAYLPPELSSRVVGSVHQHKFGRGVVLQPQVDAILRHVRLTGRERWLVIDDDPEIGRASEIAPKHLVACEPLLGLSDGAVQEALRWRLAEMYAGIPWEEPLPVESAQYRV
ncbi:hypothetical protein JJQ59_28455 [Cupriavidus necator]|uniref:HAD domain-containing protein n=1 Tax=Cupriavidus necator TaxID=106590 RepID=UPI0011BE00F1|nr:HAD domain-containing protein [Cupriavidus necator]QQX86693.1 hypothetical protein JJQ59_28455 [Cupriavidus necator]